MKSTAYKTCNRCGFEKSLSDFRSNSMMKDGLLNQCRECKNLRDKEYRSLNKKSLSASRKAWSEKNKEKDNSYKKAYKVNNRKRYLAKKSEYAKSHRAQYNDQTARYRARKLLATPKLSDFDSFVISEIYSLCELRSKLTGIKHHVDHYYPLVSDEVCGLHNALNLRIITAFENQSKGNRLQGEQR